MDADELKTVGNGSSEWARRVRELRDEEGYAILTHNDRSDLKPGEYLLESRKPKPAFARQMSKEIRAFVLDGNGFTCQMCGAVAGEPHPSTRLAVAPDCTSVTSSTSPRVDRTTIQICAPCAACATKEHKTSPPCGPI